MHYFWWQDEGIRSKIEAAIVLSLAAGINSESQDDPPYKQILNGCLAIVEDYVDMFSENIKLVCFYQFYILVKLISVFVSPLWKYPYFFI